MSFNVLSFGGGIDSTALAMMANENLVSHKLDAVIFANTGFEKRNTYKHIKEIQKILNIPFFTTTKGNIYKDIAESIANNSRISSLPFFTKNKNGKIGRLKRQCTGDYKIAAVHSKVREILGVKVLNKSMGIKMWIGFNASEPSRIAKKRKTIKTNWETISVPFYNVELTKNSITEVKYFDKRFFRNDLENYLKKFNFQNLTKSGCKCCPQMSDLMWLEMKENNEQDFKDAIEFDKMIRNIPNIESECFLHRSCKPLSEVKFNFMDFRTGCSGGCFL